MPLKGRYVRPDSVKYISLTWPPPAPPFSGWRQFHTLSSTAQPQHWPWIDLSAAQPWPPAPRHTALSEDRSHVEMTAGHGPGRSLPSESSRDV